MPGPTRTAPDPWAKYRHDPTAPKPKPAPRDWTKASAADAAWEGAKKVIPSTLGDMWTTLKSLPGAAAHTADVYYGGPTHGPGETGQFGLSPLARLASAARKNVGLPYQDYSHYSVPQAVHDVGAGLGAVAQNYHDAYLAPGGLKRTWATDPGRVVMDAQALATLPEGGEGLAATMPGRAGALARGVVKTAKTFNRATNPVALAGEVVAAGSRAAQKAVRGGPPLDRSGNWTTAARTAVQQAFPNGEIGAAELENPQFKTVLAKTFQAKGINPASAREAVLTYNGAQPVRSVATRTRAPASTAPAVDERVAAGQRVIAARAQTLAGPPTGDAPALGAALHRAKAQSNTRVDSLYREAAATPGTLHPVFKDVLDQNLQSALGQNNLPETSAALEQFPSYVKSREAFQHLQDRIGALADSNDLTFPNIERSRQELNALSASARGNDRKAIGVMRDALDQSVDEVLAHSVPVGAPPDFTGDTFKAARTAYQDHAAKFDEGNPTIRRAFDRSAWPEIDIAGAPVAPGDVAHTAAQDVLGRGLLHPSTLRVQPDAGRLYYDLGNILDPQGQEALRAHVRQTILGTDSGALAASPEQLRDFLSSPLASVFDPAEQSDIRLMAAGDELLGSRPRFAERPTLGERIPAAARTGLSALAGYGLGAVASHIIPEAAHLGPFAAELIGAGGLPTLGRIAEGRMGAGALQRQFAGAPAEGGLWNLPQGAGADLSTIARALPVIRALEPPVAPPPPERIPQDIDLSVVPGPFDQEQPAPVPTNGVDPWAKYRTGQTTPADTMPSGQDIDLTTIPGPFDEPAAAAPAPAHADQWERFRRAPSTTGRRQSDAGSPDVDLTTAPGPFDEQTTDDRSEHASGGVVAPPGASPPELHRRRSHEGRAVPQYRMDLAIQREARANGGAVGANVERLVQRLMDRAEKAKSAENRATRPMLEVPDTAVAKALAIAQRAL